jgi:hypothetical protein
MDRRSARQNVTQYRLTAAIAEARIRAIAQDSDNISWALHALERMDEREIFDDDVLSTLRLGMISGDPERTQKGEWKCKMIRQVRGSREVGVVTIILKSGFLFVKTVEWEDLS